MRSLFLAAVLIMRIAAQQLGSASDPCVGGNAWPTPPLRFGDFTCTIPAPIGTYTVTLGFQEPVVTAVGGRIFAVAINGLPVLPSFDLVAAGATSSSIVISRSFPVISDGSIRIQLSTVKRSAVLSSIAVVQQPAPTLHVTSDLFTVACGINTDCTRTGVLVQTALVHKADQFLLFVFQPTESLPQVIMPDAVDLTAPILALTGFSDGDRLWVVYTYH